MSPHDKKVLLVALNAWIAVGYMLLATSFGAIYTTLAAGLTRRKLNVPAFVMPLTWVGTALFLAGCGIHHAHLALDMIPESIDKFGKESLWIAHFDHHLVIALAQVVGAPALLIGGWFIISHTRKTVGPRGQKRSYSATSRKSD